MAIMAAETLGVDYDQVRPIVADTASVGYTHVTGGSRVTFATGMAVVNATKIVIQDMCNRAAKTWGVDPEAVVWEDGHAKRQAATSAISNRCRSRKSRPSGLRPAGRLSLPPA